MYRRYFVVASICLLTFIVAFQHTFAQSHLAQDTYAIFEASCLNCHGPDGAFRETLLMEHSELIDGGTVIPGNPDASELYKRLLGPTENGAQMPFGLPQLPPQSIDIVRRWILAGAPDWTATTTPLRRFITPREALTSIESHLNSLSSFDRSFARYFTMTHLYNAAETPEILAEYRSALYKLVNSLSWGSGIINPQPIDPQATIFYIDLRHYEWDVNEGWTKIEEAYSYHISFDAPEHLGLRNQLGRLQTQMKTGVPSVHVDWFIANASTPPLYHDLLSLPLTDRDLETRLEVDVARNLINAPGVRVWRAGFNNSGVSNHNRVVERHISRYGAYWKSYDFAGSVGTQNILTHPLNFTHDGGEAIFNLPNGLQGYYLANASGLRLDEAPINIVSNPAASDPTVRNGISCIGCHTEGMKTFEDEVRSVIESNANPPYNKAQALRLYVEQSVMDDRVSEDMETYRIALEATGGTFGGVEPVSRFHEAYQGPIDAAYAAAVVGLQTDTFLERVRENTGLQNVGLLALDNPNGSVKRDTWTSSFRDIISALDYPQHVGEPPDITQPDILPGGQVHIPDPNLRTAIAEALRKSPNAPITAEEMKRLRDLDLGDKGVRDLTGLQFATHLKSLRLSNNQVSDLSPVKGLINLTRLELERNQVSDISPVRNLTNLTRLVLHHTSVSDLSPVAGLISLHHLDLGDANVSDLSPVARLINLEFLAFPGNSISDLSPLAGLTNLNTLYFWRNIVVDLSPIAGLVNLENMSFWTNNISDISPLSGLINLKHFDFGANEITDLSPLTRLINLKGMRTWGNPVSDLSPLAEVTTLEAVDICGAELSDLSPLAALTGLKELYLVNNGNSDISPLAALTGLDRLNLAENGISDISPLAGMTNLKWLAVNHNKISDFTPLDGLRKNTKLVWHGNPGYPRGGAKIEGPWLWVLLPDTRLDSGIDILSDASGGTVTEEKIATNGATLGKPVGDEMWTSHELPSVGEENIRDMLKRDIPDGVIYGVISLYSPRRQDTTMYVGAWHGVKIWLNGALIHARLNERSGSDYSSFFPVTLKQGRNVLLVAIGTRRAHTNGFFGFEPGTEYSVGTGISYAVSETPIHIGDSFTFDVRADNVSDLAGWQFDIVFDPSILEAIDASEGDFLKLDGGTTFFQSGHIDNAAGKIAGLIAGRISEGGASGSGSLLQVEFKAKSEGETELALESFEFGSITGENIPAGPLEIHITVEEKLVTGDVNRDGRVSILDLILVAQQLGSRVPPNSPVDINGDGVVNIFDLTLVARGIVGAAAPAVSTGRADAATVEAWIAHARLEDDGSIAFRQGIANLQNLLASLIVPLETALHTNYPNPFNPETWIPYQLAASAEVTLTIYDMSGGVVRRLEMGHQAAGMYRNHSRAAHWDGRNRDGESVASGLYFYTLKAGDFSATQKMLVRK